jgi:DNA-binding transcriptional regulator PaaX
MREKGGEEMIFITEHKIDQKIHDYTCFLVHKALLRNPNNPNEVPPEDWRGE